MKRLGALKKPDISPGSVVRAFRTKFSLSMAEVQQLTGIPQPNLSAIENDRTDIGVRRAILLAAVFGIRPEDILFPQGFRRKEERAADRIREKTERYLEKRTAKSRG